MKDQMRAYVLEGGPDEVRGSLRDFPTADLGGGEVLVKVAYSGINYKDAMVAHGVGRMVRNFPHIPGVDLSGTVESDSSGRFAAGDAVIVTSYGLGVGAFGGFGEYARVPAGWVLPLPAGLTLREAMVIGTAGLTSMLSILALERNGLTPAAGEVVVSGATGGVGSMAVDILAGAGYQVAASTGKADMHGFLTGLGAGRILPREALVEEAPKVMLREEWAGAVDCAGGATLEYLLRTVKYGGSVALSGLVHSPTFSATVYPFILRGVNLLGIDSVELPMPARQAAWERLATDRKPRHLDAIAKEIGLDDLGAKLKEILDGGARGRYIVNIGG